MECLEQNHTQPPFINNDSFIHNYVFNLDTRLLVTTNPESLLSSVK